MGPLNRGILDNTAAARKSKYDSGRRYPPQPPGRNISKDTRNALCHHEQLHLRLVLRIAIFIAGLLGGCKKAPPKTTATSSAAYSVNYEVTHGRELYTQNCAACHGLDGQGVQIGDKKAGPLWGPHSWNDGAGAARIYTLAGFIRYAMPYLNPGSLTDQEAQHIAAFINSMPRPEYPFKARDYQVTKIPPDAVYYLKKKR